MNTQQVATPLVSVIVPAYNAEKFIEKTLSSVLAQTYKNIEVLVVDDGSQDRTAEIIQSFAQIDRRVTLLQQQNAGVAAARNLAIQASRGEYIAPIDADDLWYPQNLEKQVSCMLQAEPSVGLVYSWSVDIDEDELATGGFHASTIQGNVYTTLICHNFLGNASASLIRRDCLQAVGQYNCNLKEQNAQGCEDWELYLHIAERYQYQVVPEFLVGYRKLRCSMSRDYTRMAKSHDLMLQSVRQSHPEIPSAIYRLSSSSFYMYLAHQSSQHSHQSTLLWLYKALRADCISPLLRFGLYTLLLKSILGLIKDQLIRSLTRSEHHSVQLKSSPTANRTMTIADFHQRRVRIKFKILVGSILHRLISSLWRIKTYA